MEELTQYIKADFAVLVAVLYCIKLCFFDNLRECLCVLLLFSRVISAGRFLYLNCSAL